MNFHQLHSTCTDDDDILLSDAIELMLYHHIVYHSSHTVNLYIQQYNNFAENIYSYS